MRAAVVVALLCAALPAYAQQPPNCAVGGFVISPDETIWVCKGAGASPVQVSTGGGGLTAGTITVLLAGTCPSGFEEATELNGKTLVGTLAANKDVGTTGGSDSITPTGTNSAPTFTGSSASTSAVSAGTPAGTNAAPTFSGTAWSAPAIAWPAGVPTHSGTAASFTGNASTTVVNHVHTLATGTGTTGNFAQVIGTVDTSSGGNGATPTQTALGTLSGNPTAGGAASYTPTGTVAITSQGTIAWPAGVPTIGAYTPQGSVTAPVFTGAALDTHGHTVTATGTVSAPAFTGDQLDNRSEFVRVIFCRKT